MTMRSGSNETRTLMAFIVRHFQFVRCTQSTNQGAVRWIVARPTRQRSEPNRARRRIEMNGRKRNEINMQKRHANEHTAAEEPAHSQSLFPPVLFILCVHGVRGLLEMVVRELVCATASLHETRNDGGRKRKAREKGANANPFLI